MSWKKQYEPKNVSLEKVLSHVKSGDRVVVGWFDRQVCKAKGLK